ncbi:hypothetical protein B9479_006661 [Cryptococcus floricola]|uniref:Uncharacterized protein n=1 Tax=Cryptococcus floricola TaxID=2591691 RepID=A0A5D3AMI5_9TREE|nr:hypothetical protein B9479_006661 [Cryptococcus floricola]
MSDRNQSHRPSQREPTDASTSPSLPFSNTPGHERQTPFPHISRLSTSYHDGSIPYTAFEIEGTIPATIGSGAPGDPALLQIGINGYTDHVRPSKRTGYRSHLCCPPWWSWTSMIAGIAVGSAVVTGINMPFVLRPDWNQRCVTLVDDTANEWSQKYNNVEHTLGQCETEVEELKNGSLSIADLGQDRSITSEIDVQEEVNRGVLQAAYTTDGEEGGGDDDIQA